MYADFSVGNDGVNVVCWSCGEDFFVPGITQAQIDEWKGGTLIQYAMPEVPDDQRELLISGTCPKCFDEMRFDDEDAESIKP